MLHQPRAFDNAMDDAIPASNGCLVLLVFQWWTRSDAAVPS